MEPILDFQTSNHSFTDFYDKMRKKDFSITDQVLWLYHKELINIDPIEVFKNDNYENREELLDLIQDEISCNIWYFFREYVRIKTYFTTSSDIRFSIDEDIFKIIDLYNNHKYSVIIQEGNKKRHLKTTFFYILLYDIIKKMNVRNSWTAFLVDLNDNLPSLSDAIHSKNFALHNVLNSLYLYNISIASKTEHLESISVSSKFCERLKPFEFPHLDGYESSYTIQSLIYQGTKGELKDELNLFHLSNDNCQKFNEYLMLFELTKSKNSRFYQLALNKLDYENHSLLETEEDFNKNNMLKYLIYDHCFTLRDTMEDYIDKVYFLNNDKKVIII